MERSSGKRIMLLALVLLGAAGCGAATPDVSAAVRVIGIAYAPAELEVAQGATVTWVNEDAGVAHTVTSGDGGSNAVPGVSQGEPNRPDGTFHGELPAAASFSFSFPQPGTFAYFCEVHPSMRGAVIVR